MVTLIGTVVFVLNITRTFITFDIPVGCCTFHISQQKHFHSQQISKLMVWWFFIFCQHLYKHQCCFTECYASSKNIYNIYTCCWPPIYLCTSHWCSRSSAFSWEIYPSIRIVFSDIPNTPKTCITFGICISDILSIQTPNIFVHILLMLQKFHIFPGHLPKHQVCCFLDILDTPRTCITFGIFIYNISDIQPSIYLCTSCWFSRSSAFS